MSRRIRRTQQSGFTLLEMIVSLSLLLILSGAILGGMGNMQKNYRGNEIRGVLHGQMRATLEMMEQEIGQAGLPPSNMDSNSIYGSTGPGFPIATVTQPVATPGTTAQTLSISSANNSVQGGINVIADTGVNAEFVTITSVSGGTPATAITAVFQKPHATGFFIYLPGVYPNGVALLSANAPTTSIQTSYESIIVYGDITGTGTLSIVQYSCPTAATAGPADSNGVQWGPLVRTEYDYVSGAWTQIASTNMLDRVRVKTIPYGSPADGCRFDYNIFVPASIQNYMVTSINVTLVAESVYNDPTTNAPVVISKSFMNIQPRNIVNAYNLYQYNSSQSLTDLYAEFSSPPAVVVSELNLGVFTQTQ